MAVVLVAWVAGWAIVLLQPDGVVGGDVPIYHERLLAIEDGGLPYVDPVFEHLPGMLVPFYAARLFSGFGDEFAFAVVFSALMAACVLATTALLDRHFGSGVRRRFFLLAAPMLPLLMFRNDAWVVLLAVAAITPLGRAGWFGVLAILSKGWPLVLAARELFLRRWMRVAAYGAAAGVALVVMLSPGFRATQDAGGLHSETLVGSLLGLRRILSGEPMRIEWTTAVYLEADSFALLIGPAVALVFGLMAVMLLRRQPGSLGLMGALVGAVIVAFPLFSTQYAYWLLPFAAAATTRVAHGLALGTSALSLAVILTWDELFTSSGWWWLVVGRNLLLLALLIALLVDGARTAAHSGSGQSA